MRTSAGAMRRGAVLEGKIAWITGASSGIGEALAEECWALGARLVLSSRNREGLLALRERLGSPDRCFVCPLDVTRPEAIRKAVGEVFDRFPTVDLLLHAAGVSQRSRAIETEPSVERRIMETNFFGAVELSRALLPAMVEAGSGRIVVISSVFGKFGAPTRSAYAASKHALHGYFDSLRAELPPGKVGVTLVVPGAVATNISTNALTGDGSSSGVADRGIAAGMSPRRCARLILRGVLRGREEISVAFDTRIRFALLLKLIAPRLLTRILRRARLT